MLRSLDKQIYQEVAKVSISAPCIFFLNCEDRVLKIRLLRLPKAIRMLLLQLL